MAKEVTYTIKADGVKTFQDLVDIFKGISFSFSLNEKRDALKIIELDELVGRGLLTKEGGKVICWKEVREKGSALIGPNDIII